MSTKNLKNTLVALATISTLGTASVLEIYQDGAKYRTIPADRFIGLTKQVHAACEGQKVNLSASNDCSESYRLCRELTGLETLRQQTDALRYESETLEKLISIAKPTDVDAGKWISAAEKIGQQKAVLAQKSRALSSALKNKRVDYGRQAPSQKPLALQKKCAGELELTLPAGYIGAELRYEADVTQDDKIHVRQYLSVTNHSGIDIVAKDLYVYARSYRVYLQPQHFSPWVVRIQRARKMLRKSKVVRQERYAETAMMENEVGGDISAVVPMASMGAVVQTGYKNYHVSGVELPSTGEEIKVKIADYEADTVCEKVSYPYMDRRVYRACSFLPAGAIEANQWRIQKEKRLVTDQAYGEYREGRYHLNVEVDEEILVERKPIVKKDRSSGIFGGSIKKKDGYVLTLSNISEVQKTLKIMDRIPTSSTDKIKVKLLKVDGARSHRVLKDGKLELSVTLPPKSEQKVTVWFELSYDKETKVAY